MKIVGRTFLLVEDEPIIGFALEDMMIEEGAQTQFASSLEQALKLARSSQFDAALLDVNLHGKESYPVARELLERGTIVVFATGYGVEPLPDDLVTVPTIAKPYDINTIRDTFDAITE